MADHGPTDDDRNRRFDAERDRQDRRLPRIVGNTDAEVTRILNEADAEITRRLGQNASEFEQFQLPALQQSIREILSQAGGDTAEAVKAGATEAFQAGAEMVTEPIAAGGIRIAGILPELDPAKLMAMRQFLTFKLKDVSLDTVNRINSELGLVLTGVNTMSQAIGRISPLLGTGRGRALTIARTELGRAYSIASQQRLDQARERLPGLRKQWRRSGKLHSRVNHDVVDGQIRKTDEAFNVGGEQLMFPRDPKGSPKNTINCGCTSLPYMASWEMRHPAGQPFSDHELRNSEIKRRLSDVQVQGFSRWTQGLERGKLKAAGNFETVGGLGQAELAFLRSRGITPATTEIAVSDRRILHMVRQAKRDRRQDVPIGEIRALPRHLADPAAVYWDQRAFDKTGEGTLIYVFKVRGLDRVARIPVRIRRSDPRTKVRSHNWVVSGSMVQPDDLRRNAPAYVKIFGDL